MGGYSLQYWHHRRRGLCARCKAPAAPGRSRCARHLEEARAASLARWRRLGRWR